MNGAVGVYNDPVRAGVMPSLVAALRHQPELAGAIRDGFLTKRREALRAVLDRGVARGDLARDIDVELALDVLGGPLFYRLLITGGPLDDALVEGVGDLILRGFAPAPPGPVATPTPPSPAPPRTAPARSPASAAARPASSTCSSTANGPSRCRS